eukprot:73355-Rhodomonas_salina.1
MVVLRAVQGSEDEAMRLAVFTASPKIEYLPQIPQKHSHTQDHVHGITCTQPSASRNFPRCPHGGGSQAVFQAELARFPALLGRLRARLGGFWLGTRREEA